MSSRKNWYGDGRQPWDDIVDQGWAADFCAANILKYLRRSKDPEHSLESAKWYYARLVEMSRGQLLPADAKEKRYGPQIAIGRANAVLIGLQGLLTLDEKERL